MINESQARKYCREDITLIKNYAEAIADKTRTWICHHINGEPFTGFCKEDLKKMNMYEHRPASELMFVTRGEHRIIHGTGTTLSEETKNKISVANTGKHLSEESRKKLSESHKGKTGYFKGKHISDEHRKKISSALRGKTLSEKTRKKMSVAKKDKLSKETRKKLSETHKGKHWYNNGIVNTFAKSCPEGFVEGKIRKYSKTLV